MFKKQLIVHFKNKFERKQKREKYLTETYDKLMHSWLKKLESKEINPLKKTKDNKLREFFEKQFPELRKQREDKERLSRAGQRVRSDADLEDIMDGIQEQELEDKKIRAYAVIPPILHDEEEKVFKFTTTNCRILDPVAEHKELQLFNVWTDSEKEIFKEKFLQAPKNFGLIASYLDRKSVMDCVQYYYSSKKRENYKQLLRKNAKKRTRALAKAQQQAAQQQAAQQAAQQQQEAQLQLQRSLALQARHAKQELEKDTGNKNEKINKSEGETIVSSNDANRKENTDNSNNSLEDTLKCSLCESKIEASDKTYTLNVLNHFLYSVSIDDVKPNAKICCKCKAKFGTGQCPVPSCRTPDKQNRRLKSLPRDWFELTPDLRYTYSAELNFPLDCKRCCSQCWIRLIRKYKSSFKHTSLKKYLDCQWDDVEIEKLKTAIRKNGRNWNLISAFVGSKNGDQCKKFYFYYKYSLKLNELMRLTTFQTVDSDSDSDWNGILSDNDSSEDEYAIERKPEINKLQAPNVIKLQECKKLSLSQTSVKSDCDSSATMSADEGQSNCDPELGISSPSLLMQNPPRANSAIPAYGCVGSLYNSDKNRPASHETFENDIKGIKCTQPNQRYLDNLIAQQKQRIPSFLINPNAPTVPSTNHSKHVMPQETSVISNCNMPMATSAINQQFVPTVSQSVKDKPICVRDLIHEAIEISLQSPVKSAKSDGTNFSSSTQSINKQDKQDNLNCRPTMPFYIPPDLKRETVLSDSKSKINVPLYTQDPQLNLLRSYTPDMSNIAVNPLVNPLSRAEQIQMISSYPHNITPLIQQCISETENEVQDLSKKATKKEFIDDYNQPKNYAFNKNKDIQHYKTNYGHLVTNNMFNNPMPPPAHSNQLSRTSTPGLDTITQIDSSRDMHFQNRHTESPKTLKNLYQNDKSNQLTPSPTPSNRGLSLAQNVGKVSIPPPPLITNSSNQNNISQFLPKIISANQGKAILHGSITQGTPVHLSQQQTASSHQFNKDDNRFDCLLKNSNQQTNSNRESSGSITLGTPMYDSCKRKQDNKSEIIINSSAKNNLQKPLGMFDPAIEQFYRRMSPSSFVQGQSQFNVPVTSLSSFMPNSNQNNKKNINFGNESQMSTQNQIMIDFNTSKQMQSRRAPNTENKERSSFQQNKLIENQPKLISNVLPQNNLFPVNYAGLPLNFGSYAPQTGPLLKHANSNISGNNLKAGSPLNVELVNVRPTSISPKISSSPSGMYRQNVIQQNKSNQSSSNSSNKNNQSVIQNANSQPQNLSNKCSNKPFSSPSPNPYPASHDAFTTLVNAAAAQQSLIIPNKKLDKDPDSNRNTRNESPEISKTQLEKQRSLYMSKLNSDEEISGNSENLIATSSQSSLRFSRDLFTKEQFEREFKQQEIIKKMEDNKEDKKNITMCPSDLDNEASRIFSDSFQKDSKPVSINFTAANLIDAIITHQINQTDNVQKQVQSSNKPSTREDHYSTINKDKNLSEQLIMNSCSFPNQLSSFTLGEHIKTMINNDYNLKDANLGNLSDNHLISQPITQMQLMQDRALLSNRAQYDKQVLSGITTQSDINNESQNWKLRKVLEQKKNEEKKDIIDSNKTGSRLDLSNDAFQNAQKSLLNDSSLNINTNWNNLNLLNSDTLVQKSNNSIPIYNNPQMHLLAQQAFKSGTNNLNSFDYVQNRIVEVMRNSGNEKTDSKEEDLKDSEANPKKRIKMAGEDDQTGLKFSSEDVKKNESEKNDKLPHSSLETITSLSELKAQRAEFQKQQQMKQHEKKQLIENSDESDEKRNADLPRQLVHQSNLQSDYSTSLNSNANVKTKQQNNSPLDANLYEPLSDEG